MHQERSQSRFRRLALALVAGVAGVSILSGLLMPLQGVEPEIPWAGLEASLAGPDPSCTTADPRDRICQRNVAITAPGALASTPAAG